MSANASFNIKQTINSAEDSKQHYLAMKSMARGYAGELVESDRLSVVHAFCILMMSSYWDTVVKSKGAKLKIKKPPAEKKNLRGYQF